MDEDIARWVLEFLLRQPIDDRTINSLLSVLPLSNSDSRLKKTLLLRRIQSEESNATVSEKILDFLEIIEEIDQREGKPASESMKEAYCAVAVDCTVRFIDRNAKMNADGNYFEAVKRIWLMRVSQMRKRYNGACSGLLSEKLMQWREDIEAAMWDPDACEKIFTRNTRDEALKAVEVYLSEAWGALGPSFLQLAAEKMNSKTRKCSCVDGGNKGAENLGNPCRDLIVYTNAAVGGGGGGDGGGLHDDGQQGVDMDGPAVSGDEGGGDQLGSTTDPLLVHKESSIRRKVQVRNKHVAAHSRRIGRSRRPKLVDCGDDKYAYVGKNDPVPTSDVKTTKSSSKEQLKARVEPFLAQVGAEKTNGVAHVLVVPNSSSSSALEDVQMTDNDAEDDPVSDGRQSGHDCRQKTDLPGSSKVQNRTPDVYVWSESAEKSSGEPPDRLHRSRVKRSTVPPVHDVRSSPRRKRKLWSPQEEEMLRRGVKKFGRGNWAFILRAYRDVFQGRTDIDLKDKWRNLAK